MRPAACPATGAVKPAEADARRVEFRAETLFSIRAALDAKKTTKIRGRRPMRAALRTMPRLERGIRATPDTRHRVASISEGFVAAAALRAQEAGRLSIGQPIAAIAPGVQDAGGFSDEPVTLAPLFEHSSGFDEMRFNEIISDWLDSGPGAGDASGTRCETALDGNQAGLTLAYTPAMSHESTAAFRERVRTYLLSLQDQICAGLEQLDGGAVSFLQDEWQREGGGGGRSRVLADGEVLEKAGVNFSEVHGMLGGGLSSLPGSGEEFYATGVSLVLHPHSPHVPTAHANFRHIQRGSKAWFGGGADLTPYYFDRSDRDHFHATWRAACEAHADVANYDELADWCDRYFYLPHRRERRGVGGIFFDYLWVLDDEGRLDTDRAERVFAFVRECGDAFLRSYLPIARRHLDEPVSEAQRRWHELRRGRYVEFNLVYDRGTVFGLKTGGRTESILMSLPPRVRWDYGFRPAAGSPEAKLLAYLQRTPLPEREPAPSA